MSRIELERLTAPVPSTFERMTFPIYRRLLALERTSRHPEQGDERQIQPLGIAVRCDGDPAGLILAELPVDEAAVPGSCAPDDEDADSRAVQVLSVFVEPSRRRQGLATALFAELEGQAAELGFADLAAVYTTGKPAIGHLERIFAHRGWSPPKPRTASVRFALEAGLASDLVADERRLAVLSRGLEIFPWSELEPEERQELKRSQSEEPWIAPGLVPWHFDRHGYDPSSVGGRFRGRVVGWAINHRIAPDSVRFTCSFMRGDLSRRGRILPLYAAALRRLEGTACRWCTFVTPYSFGPMVEFIRRRLAPIATALGETRESRRSLDAPDPAVISLSADNAVQSLE